MDMNLSTLWEIVEDRGPGMLQPLGSQKVEHDFVIEQHTFIKGDWVFFPLGISHIGFWDR